MIITGFATVDTAVTAMKYGAADVFTKPIKSFALLSQIERILAERPRRAEIPEDERVLTTDPQMREALTLIERAAPTDAPILIRGKRARARSWLPGWRTGPAGATRARSWRSNCAAMPDTLLESEMFGHERGAFTDARERKRGLLEIADGGTIFLDEIGEMSLATQAKMLRVLEEKCYTRLGGVETIHSDCRVVAATNRDIEAAIRAGTFREELLLPAGGRRGAHPAPARAPRRHPAPRRAVPPPVRERLWPGWLSLAPEVIAILSATRGPGTCAS